MASPSSSPSPSPGVDDVSVDLRPKILKQVEYYFSDENLPNDRFLLEQINGDELGFVSIEVIASFRKMQRLTKDIALILDALKESSLLVVSRNQKKVRRRHALPLTEFKDPNPKLCTVLVENLSKDNSREDIQRIFGQAGSIKSICICDPPTAADFKQNSKAEKLLSGKLHILVEYETVEAAEKAVLTLNEEKDLRNVMRVQLLEVRMGVCADAFAWKDHILVELNNKSQDVANLRLELDRMGEMWRSDLLTFGVKMKEEMRAIAREQIEESRGLADSGRDASNDSVLGGALVGGAFAGAAVGLSLVVYLSASGIIDGDKVESGAYRVFSKVGNEVAGQLISHTPTSETVSKQVAIGGFMVGVGKGVVMGIGSVIKEVFLKVLG